MNSQYLKKPILTKTITQNSSPTFTSTSIEMQGWRRTMQDSQISLQLQPNIHLFAVLDGHGGPEVATYAAKYLPTELMNQPYYKLRNYHRALINLFERIDHMIESARGQKDLKEINKEVKGGKVKNDEKVGHKAGTTAVVILMTKDKYYTANIGDSRAVLCRSGQAIALSTDHKPDLTSQHNRIEKAGGYVDKNRINGSLNLSRAFGDFDYKNNQKLKKQQQFVISQPQITQTARNQEQDQFILLGCDGVWQRYVSNNQKMVQTVSGLLQKNEDKGAMDKLFSQLLAKSQKDQMGFDNMTAVLVRFK